MPGLATAIPAPYADLVERMATADADLRAALRAHGLTWEEYPDLTGAARERGAAAALAYPMQGVLKYHGLSDWDYRIAFLPSVSLCNDAGHTLTLVEFDPDLATDCATINGHVARGRELERVRQSLDAIRAASGATVRARVMSRNVTRGTRMGKGLGSSAAASAALALAAIAALYGDEAAANRRLVSCMARLLAGSGCRSAAGGCSIWFSSPGMPHEDSFAVRLDDAGQLDDVRLITVPLDSRIGLKTEQAHLDAPGSALFRCWMLSRRDEALACIAAARTGDWRTLGQWAELDSMRLHGITMSGSLENKLIGWEPENIVLFRMCNDLRSSGVPVYCSTDTGPTAVFITHRDYEDAVVSAIEGLGLSLEAIRGRVAGPARLVDIAWAGGELGVAD
ncbi:diphosphomevalonate/mevalonate 3,5-bisphosphate decarboxylase family protein [Roseiflexus castenholzii]|jgi:diphosphomevalonate decarboxylase